MANLDRFSTVLNRLAADHRRRRLIPQAGLDFSSNDYLGIAGSGALSGAVREAIDRGVPIGAGGSRLLRGNHPEHEALEDEAAAFFGADRSLFFANGFAANGAIFAALPDRRDLIVHDALIHASVHDGMRLGFAEKIAVPHGNNAAIEDAITRWRAKGGKGRPWIAVESVYSMDGDLAPLTQLAEIAERHEAMLVIDEAHAAGVFGREGRGCAADLPRSDAIVRLVTCGKTLGCEGALVLGAAPIIETLVNKGRSFIFSTAPSPLMAAAVRASLRILVQKPERQMRLFDLIDTAKGALGEVGAAFNGSQIVPLVIGDDGETMRIAARLQEHGFDVRGIRPPTVPKGTARLRISITLNVEAADILALADVLKEVRG